MQKIVILTVVMITAIATQAQWKWLNPKPSGHHNTKITFVDNQHGFLFNSIGELYETVDTGNSWQLQQRFPNSNVFALKDSTGVIGGNSGLLYISEDNGQHWQIKNIDQNINIAWIDITSRDTIFLIGSGNLYRSVNRGNSWELMNNSFTFRLPSVDFVSAQTGYAVYPASSIYKTVDGGKTWNVVNGNSTTANSTSLQFADSLFGYAFRESDKMLRTTDGGKTWTAAMLTAQRMNDIFILNAQKAFAVGEDGAIFKTVDGGVNWSWSVSTLLLRYGNTLNTVYFINENIGFAAGLWGRLMKTTDGGATWKESLPTYIDFSTISMGSPGTGYTTNWNNLFKTTDSGKSWQPLPLTVGDNYTGTYRFDNCIFFNADTGLVTCNNSVRMFRTVNGGQTFDTIKPFANIEDALLGLHFINASQGWCTIRSYDGKYKVYRTKNGGYNWNEISSTASYGPKKIFFANEAVGYGAQYGGIVQTMDSGKTWTPVYMDYDNAYNSLWFVNAKKGFAAGEHGKLRMTNDSGRTWTTIPFNDFYDDFLNVRFFSDSVGYLTGEDGGIFKTIDGGLTWKRRNLPPFFDYHDYGAISFTSDSTVYIAGTNGSIIKSSIAEVVVDSLQANNLTGCSAGFSAKITADLCSVDSVWFQFGINRFDRSVAASPAAVTNGTIKVTAQALNLVSNTAYRVKVKVLYGGKYYYSDEVVCKTRALVTPVITVNNYVLTSSVDTGNQWYRNDTLIPGAVNKQYTVVTTGAYKTRVLNGVCPAAFSQPVQVTMPVVPPVTGIIDPVLNAALRIYPNPVYDRIHIDNENRYRLGISVTDITGQQVIHLNQTREQLISLPAQKLSPGIYLLHITDLQTKRMITRKFVKLQ
jgi:photosystem II stability/assembly factor-like uncharacterized protein